LLGKGGRKTETRAESKLLARVYTVEIGEKYTEAKPRDFSPG